MVLSVSPLQAAAQNPPCTVECPGIRLLVELDSRAGPVVPSQSQVVVRTPAGHYLVSHLFADPQIVVYDSTGRMVRLYDRVGEGPGELATFPLLLSGRGDTVIAAQIHQLQLFDSDLDYIGLYRAERRVWQTAAALPGGRLAVDDQVPTDRGTTETVSILDRTGAVEAVVEEEVESDARTLIAPSSTGGFWTLPGDGVELRRYRPNGDLEHSVRIEGGMVAPSPEQVEPEADGDPPPPTHARFTDLADGTLLVLVRIPAEGWAASRPGAAFNPAELDQNERYDTVIERVDAGDGRVLASRRVPQVLYTVGGAPELLHSQHPQELGHVVTRIWEVDGSEP